MDISTKFANTTNALPAYILPLLECPFCQHSLTVLPQSYKCTACGDEYPVVNGQPDLRLRRPKTVNVQIEIGEQLLPDKGFNFDILHPAAAPEVDFTNFKVPWHFTRALLSHFKKAKTPESVVLDLGCGRGIHREVCEHAGYKYVGFDYGEADAPMLADGHALPFKDNSFDFLISINVLEHIQNPFVMMKEAYRVLKPGGTMIGTVAFLEPFHQNSFYHHTHLGAYNTLKSSGFKVQKVSPNEDWLVLKAQSRFLFLRMPSTISNLIVTPVYYLHRAWWKAASLVSKKATESYRLLLSAGSFRFIAAKPE
jgi:SAM-dependent methyltransferase